ncbi:AMIN-like domain-containing (lipo)protein [Melittangium boletus]|uniref:AMIN-like domain-containing (lipo)protein n=1 Tax=Melittangium boletus TaxID=83453 RepID=UPI003DA5D5C0
MTRKVVVPVLGLVVCLAGTGCSKDSAPPPARVAELPTTPPAAPAPTPTPAPAPTPAPTPAEPTPAAPAAPDTAPQAARPGDWTERRQELSRPDLKPVTLREVRAARNEGFDRVVFQFDTEQVPGYRVEYLDTPAIHCGSGDEVPVAGQARLQVSLQPAQAHENGQSTVTERARKPALPMLAEMKLTCDFEGEVSWVFGVKEPRSFRVLELKAPARLVVDIQH